MTEQLFIRQFGQMPEGMKQEVLTFFEYLLFKYKIQQTTGSVPMEPQTGETFKKSPKAGFLKGTFMMSEDFSAPLDDFKEYM